MSEIGRKIVIAFTGCTLMLQQDITFQHESTLTLRYNFSSNVSGRASTGIGAGGTLEAAADGMLLSGS